MAKVIAKVDNATNSREDVESLIKRFKKQVLTEDILYECKKREYFMPKSLKRKEKALEAIKRQKRKK